MKIKSIILFILCMVPIISDAKILYYGTVPEMVSIVYGQTTILHFNQEVKTISQASQFIIEATDPANPNYQLLAIRPRDLKSEDKLTFILANEAVVTLNIKTVPAHQPDKTDNMYDLRPKDEEVDPMSREDKGANITELELMKAMIRNDSIVGYQYKALVRTIPSGEKDIVAQLIKVYTGPKFNGYVFKVQNTSKASRYAIDLKSLTFGKPNVALLSQSDHQVIPELGITYLRIVTKPTSTYYEVTLPIAPMGKKQGENDEV